MIAIRRFFDRSALLVLIILLIAVGYTLLALRYPIGELSRPGPGMVPLAAGVLASVLLTVGLFVRQPASTLPIEEDQVDSEVLGESRWWRSLIFLGVLIVYVVLLQIVGQVLASAVMVLATLLLCRARPVWQMLLAAAGIAVISFLVFAFLLGVPLPTRLVF